MTNQQAIEILEGLAVPIHAEAAFDMAIEALKQPERKKGHKVIHKEDHSASNIIYCNDCDWYDDKTKHQVRCRCEDKGVAAGLVRCKQDDYCSYAKPKSR